jgi:hypothetical protein
MFFSAAGSDDPKKVRNWRILVSVFIVAGLIYGAWELGAFSRFGFTGVARAADVDEKIKAAIDPLNAKLVTQDGYLKRLVKSDLRDELTMNYLKLCTEEDAAERQHIRDDIEDLQTEYKKLTGGDRYPQPPCSDL